MNKRVIALTIIVLIVVSIRISLMPKTPTMAPVDPPQSESEGSPPESSETEQAQSESEAVEQSESSSVSETQSQSEIAPPPPITPESQSQESTKTPATVGTQSWQELYEDGQIIELYALDAEKGWAATSYISDDLFSELDSYREDHPSESQNPARFGYVLETSAGKEYLYFGGSAPTEYINRCKNNFDYDHRLRVYPFTTMQSGSIQRMEFEGTDSTEEYNITADVTDPAVIAQVAQALESAIPFVQANVTGNRINYGEQIGLYTLTITFDTGEKYYCHGYSGGVDEPNEASLFVYSTATNTTMSYIDVQENEIDVIRDIFLKS